MSADFIERDPPVEAYRVPRPTIEQVDAHPDAAFIWAVIIATRTEALTKVPGVTLRRPIFAP
jgi:hypothetical protein